MKLEDMSNFELERRLSYLQLKQNKNITNVNERESVIAFEISNGEIVEVLPKKYCTDCAVTMPIAFEHGVGIIKHAISDEWSSHSPYQVNYDHLIESDFECFCESPLRAIVICLIKVLEAKGGNNE